MSEMQRLIWEVLTSGKMSGEDVAQALTDYHGTQLLDEGFAKHLVDDGYCLPENVGFDPYDTEMEDDDEELS